MLLSTMWVGLTPLSPYPQPWWQSLGDNPQSRVHRPRSGGGLSFVRVLPRCQSMQWHPGEFAKMRPTQGEEAQTLMTTSSLSNNHHRSVSLVGSTHPTWGGQNHQDGSFIVQPRSMGKTPWGGGYSSFSAIQFSIIFDKMWGFFLIKTS